MGLREEAGQEGEEAEETEEMREEKKRVQEELERKRLEVAVATQAALERAAAQQAEAELSARLRAEETKRLEAERAVQVEKERKLKKEREAQREADEKVRRVQRQAEEERERAAREVEAVKAREREAQRRAEVEKERVEQEKVREEERKVQAAAAALAFASRPIHPCRYSACTLDGRITASQYYVRLVCSAHCHIFFHSTHTPSDSTSTPQTSLSCWQLVPSSPTSSDSPPLSSLISSFSPCPTPDCDGSIVSLTLLHGKDEVIAHLIRPPPSVKKPPAPVESKRERRARKREEEKARYEREEKKEEEVEGKGKVKGGFEVLVPAKEKDFSPVIPRPSFFSPSTPPDESKERPSVPTSPPPASAAPHPPAKKGRQARRTRIDIYLPEAEVEAEAEAEEEVEAEKVEAVRLHSIDMSGSAYGGVVRTVTDGSTTSLLYVRAFPVDLGEDDGDATSQWLIEQCALVAPICVTRLFAPTAVLVKFETAAFAERAYVSLHSRMFMQFAVEPCSLVTGAEAFNLSAYHDLLMAKQCAPHIAQVEEFTPAAFDDFTVSTTQRTNEVAPHYTSTTSPSLDFVSPPPPPSRAGLNSLSRGADEDEGELDADQFDFSFLAIGGDEDAVSPPICRTDSTSPSPSTEAARTTAADSTSSPTQSFASFTAWTSPAPDSASSAWTNASPAHTSTQFTSLPGMASVFSPMHLSSPSSVTPLFSPSSPAQKDKGGPVHLTPALDPIVGPQLSSSLGFTATLSESGTSRPPPSTAPSSYFSSSSLFSSSPSSTGSTTTSSLFQLSSFSMFSSSSSPLTDTTTSPSSIVSITPAFAPPSSSFFSSSAVGAGGGVRGRGTASDGDDDDDDVWNDEKLSCLVLKSDVEEDDDPPLPPTHPRHESIDHTDSHDRESSDSSQQRHYDPDMEREYSTPDSPHSSHTPTPPLPYAAGGRGYGTASPSQLQPPRFIRPWYPAGAMPQIPPPMFNAPTAIPLDAAYQSGYGGYGVGQPIPAYGGYTPGYGGGYGAQAYAMTGGWYGSAAPYPSPPYVQMQMGMGVSYMQMGRSAPGMPGYAPLRRTGQKSQPPLPSHMSTPPNGDCRPPPSAGHSRPDDPEPSHGGQGREKGRGKKGFVVDLEADFPSLAPAVSGPSIASPTSVSTTSPASVSVASSAPSHPSSTVSASSSSYVTAPMSPRVEAASSAAELPSWTGHLATRLSKPPTSSSTSSSTSSPVAVPTAAITSHSPSSALLAPASPSASHVLSTSPPQSAEGGGKSKGQSSHAAHTQWRSSQGHVAPSKEKEGTKVRESGNGDSGRGKKEGKGSGEKGGAERRRSSGKANGGGGDPHQQAHTQGGAKGGGSATAGGGNSGHSASHPSTVSNGTSGSSEWTEVAGKKKRK